ncbi:KAP family NTPase [Bacillus cereus]|uniref:KAP family P-loop NTPase fold protein n=1 Tax=Bacillus cereus TaxID=1396 RepID=UPI00227E66A1|nr:KAP family NTPase [Bacillus cereus]
MMQIDGIQEKREKLIKIISRMITVIILFVFSNIILTISRNILHNKIQKDFLDPWIKLGFYGLVGLLLLSFLILYLISSISSIETRREIFSSMSDFMALIIPISIIFNYYFINTPFSFWTGEFFSDLFDIVMIFSILMLLYFVIEVFIRYFMPMKEYEEDEQDREYYSSGNPIKDVNEDKLNRASFAQKIAQVLNKHGEESLTIGILGDWGSGKSSVYNLVKKSSDDSRVLFIDFKPWYFGENNHDIIRFYLLQFLDAIKKTRGYNPKIGKMIKKYADVLSSVSIRSVGTTVSIKELVDKLMPSQEAVNLAELKKEIEELLKEYPKRIVVYIDDIDRLEGAEIRMIFKLVRLVADFPKVTYILALDEEVIKKSLASIYEFEERNDSEDAMKYIEKFIQIPIYLPKPDSADLYQLSMEQLLAVMEENNVYVGEEEEIINSLINLNFSPRNISRYINLIKFYVPFLKEEINVKDLLYLLLIQVSSPEVYHAIYINKSLFTGKDFQEAKIKLDKIPRINEYKEILYALFPYAPRLFEEEVEKDNEIQPQEWERDKRLCSDKFFNHYFMYNIPRNSLSQAILTNLIHCIQQEDKNTIKVEFFNLINEYGANEVKEKLKHRLPEINKGKEILFTILLESYQEQYEKFRKQEISGNIMSLAKSLAKDIYSEKERINLISWENSNIIFMLNIYVYLQFNNINEANLNLLKKSIRDAYRKNSEVNFFTNFNEYDAKRIWEKWGEFYNEQEIKMTVDKWIKSDRDFEEFLSYIFRDSDLIKIFKGDDLLFHRFITTTSYLTDERIKKYFKGYASPKNKNELKTFVENNDNSNNIGMFILGKNNLFEYIHRILVEGLQLSIKQGNFAEFDEFIREGISLIIKFGGSKQREIIKNLNNDIDEYNSLMIKDRISGEEFIASVREAEN